MKTGFKFQQTLQTLLELSVLREDNYLFSKIIIYQPDKRLRARYTGDLKQLQEIRIKLQNQQIDINQYWKMQLFQFSNRIYKIIKNFHQKLITFSVRIAEMVQTNLFLQQLRANTIEQLAEGFKVKKFMQILIERLRKRYDKQISAFNTNYSTSKCLELIRREQNYKNNRFLMLIRDQGPEVYINSHRRALIKIQKQMTNLIIRTSREDEQSVIDLISDLMDFEQNYVSSNNVIMHNGISLNLSFKQQGICQFIISKWHRLFKQFKIRNIYNQKFISKFAQKYTHFLNRSKICIKNSNKKLQTSQIKQSQTPNTLASTMQIRDQSVLAQTPEALPLESKLCSQEKSKRNAIFKIQKTTNRKRSYTLRPLGESKQNGKQVLHQKLMQMKLEDEACHFSKIVRIRKLKPFPLTCEQNGWSLLMKESGNKLGFFIH